MGLRQDSGNWLGADTILPDPVNTKSSPKDEVFKRFFKIEGIGVLEDSLLAPDAAERLTGQHLH